MGRADSKKTKKELEKELNEALLALSERQSDKEALRKREESLRDTNELLERVFSTMNVLIAYLDRDFNFIKVNKAYADADQRDPAFFPGKNHFELYPDEENEAIFRKVVLTGEPYFAFEKPFVYAANPERGTTYWDWSLQPLKEPDGKVAGLVLTLVDVTDRKRAEDALWDNERKYRGIFDSTFQFTGLLTPDGEVVEINRTALDFAGLAPSDVINRPFWETPWWGGSPAGRERLRAAIAQAARGRFVRYETELLGKEGKAAIMDFSLKPVTDYSGRVTHLIPEGRDITERKEMESKISRGAARVRALDKISHAFAETGLDVPGIMKTVVGFMAELIGDSALIRLLSEDGKTFGDFEFQCTEAVAENDLRCFLETPQPVAEGLHGKVVSSGKPVLLNEFRESGPGALPPPFISIAENFKIRSFASAPLKYEGNVLGVLTMARHRPGLPYTQEDLLLQEIADRAALAISNARLYHAVQKELAEKRRLEELMREREFISAILNTMGNLVVVLDNEGHIVSFNKSCERLTGYRAEEIKGKYVWDYFIVPEEQDKVTAAFKELSVGNYPLFLENYWKCRDGSLRMVSWANTVLLDNAGSVKYIVGTGTDITERRLAEEEREKLVAHMEELVKERTAELAQRIKEMDCLYSISGLLARTDTPLDEIFQTIAGLLHAAHPDTTCARVNIAGAEFCSEDPCAGMVSYTADILVSGRKAGFLEIRYSRLPAVKAFAREQQELLKAAAERIGLTLERKYAEEALKEREEKLSLFRSLIEQSNDAVFITDPGTGRLLDVNERACKNLGYTRDELLSLCVWDISATLSDRETWKRHVDELREKGMAIKEGAQRRKDGSTFPVEANTKYIIHEQKEYTVTVVRDITERKRAEEERVRLVAAVESTAEAVMITSPEGVIQYVNPAFEQITGYSRKEAAGKYFYAVDGAGGEVEIYNEMRASLRSGKTWSGRLSLRKKDGAPYQEDITIAPVKDPAGRIMNYVAVKRDITEKLRLESIAEAVNTMNNIGYIFSGIRHEIGNPVNSMKTALSVLKGKLDTAPKETIREYIDRAISEVSRLEYLLKALRNFNMYESPDMKNIPLDSFVRIFTSLTASDFEKKGIRLELDISPQAEHAYADPRALQQVLLNIITNAADALEGKPDPRISIKIMKMEKMILIRVSDNGCGMSKKQQKELFMPFYTTKTHGTGLGLMIAKKMMARMNGNIQITSEPGAGTVVDLFLQEEPFENT
jgi:PAS domain S-box-containing protein